MTIGLHILGDRGRDEGEIQRAITASGGRTHVVMNNPGIAAQAVLAGKRVLYRRWVNDHDNPGDNNAQDHSDAREFVRRMHADAPPGCILVLGNEPWCQTPAQMQKLSAWTMIALDECEKVGRKGAIFSLPVGNPPDAAVWQHATTVLSRAKAGGHLLVLHEYWGAKKDLNGTSANNYPWLIGKFKALDSFLNVPEIVIGEFGLCYDMQSHVGYRGKMSDDDYGRELGRITRQVYAERGIDACVFALGSVSDDFGSFSVSDKVIERIAEYNATEASQMPVETFPPAPIPLPVPPSPSGWYWHRPVRAPFVITSPFGTRVRPEDWNKPADQQRTETHFGTDYTAADWTAYAPREGKVIFAGWNSDGFGNLVTTEHEGGYTSLLGHLESISVRVGDRVTAGQKVGVIGSTGRSTARHLHWETRKDGVPYAPAPETRPHPLDIAPSPIPAPLPTPTPTPTPDAMLTLCSAADDAWQKVLELRRQRDEVMARMDSAVIDFEVKQKRVSEARNELRSAA